MSDALSIPGSPPHAALLQDSALGTLSKRSEQFLRFQVVPDTMALLPIQQIAEVLTTAQITPVPHMPAWIMGIHNWRGEILWMINLGHLCGLTRYPQSPNSAYEAIVLQLHHGKGNAPHSRQALGLVVELIEESEWCDPAVIQPPPKSMVNSQFERFLRGFWWKSNDAMLAVLDGEAIVQAMPKH